MFILRDKRYEVDGRELMRKRLKHNGCTLERFAYLCGWTSAYQWKLENGAVKTVCEEAKNLIEGALEILDENRPK